jgi:hypothetical protein
MGFAVGLVGLVMSALVDVHGSVTGQSLAVPR